MIPNLPIGTSKHRFLYMAVGLYHFQKYLIKESLPGIFWSIRKWNKTIKSTAISAIRICLFHFQPSVIPDIVVRWYVAFIFSFYIVTHPQFLCCLCCIIGSAMSLSFDIKLTTDFPTPPPPTLPTPTNKHAPFFRKVVRTCSDHSYLMEDVSVFNPHRCRPCPLWRWHRS